jgi:hypothetical protein
MSISASRPGVVVAQRRSSLKVKVIVAVKADDAKLTLPAASVPLPRYWSRPSAQSRVGRYPSASA